METSRVHDPVTGLWYQDIPGKGRVYDSPVAYGGQKPNTGGGLVHKSPQWDQNTGSWDTGIDWGKIYTLATMAMLGVGGADAMGAFGGAEGAGGAASGGGAAGTLPATTLPGSSTLGGGMTAGASGGIAAAPSGLMAAGGGVGASAVQQAAGHTQQAADAAKALTTKQRIEGLVAGLGGLLGGKALGGALGGNDVPPQLNELLQLSLDRAKSQQGLFNQVNSGVSQMLPTFAGRGGG